MSDPIENLIMAETRRQGVKPNAEAIQKAAIELAGTALTTGGLIHLPGRGTISPGDFVRSLRAAMPESFPAVGDDKPDPKSAGNLTQTMRLEVAATRRARPLPDDWNQVRAKYDANSVTGQMLAQREREWK